jgi:hypothetical protein
MTSLNKSVANSPDGHTLSMFEYWQLLESSVYTQQAETGSYDPLKMVTSKEAVPISGNLTFQVSPSSRFAVNDLHNAYLLLEVGINFIYTISGADGLTADIILFIGDKCAGNFIQRYRICCNDNPITEILDFVFETNILGSIIADWVKSKKLETFTVVGDIAKIDNADDETTTDNRRSVCGKYINARAFLPGSHVKIRYNIKFPMTSFNLFDKLRYLPTFFGNWTLDIIPTLENMIMKRNK